MGLYQAALGLLMPLVWRYFRRRGAKDSAYLEHWDERRGQGAPFASDVWIHAVSLGEFRSAEPLIRLLLAEGKRLVITHATPAGRKASEAALAEAVANGQVAIRYAPVDRISYWRRLFEATRPNAGVVMEMEFWAGMTEAARRSGVPLWFSNAQIPAKSYPRALAWRRFLGSHPAARGRGVLAKSERMAERFRSLGAEDVRALGETRFDIPIPKAQAEAADAFKAKLAGRPIVAFASVVAGEEQVYIAAAKVLADDQRRPFVVWVPRAPEAFDETARLFAENGLAFVRRSDALDRDLSVAGDIAQANVLLGDSFGEMFFYLSAADVVSVGGGFTEKGAHNVIEPLALGKAVVVGPHVWTIEFPGEEARSAGLLTICDEPTSLAAMLISKLDHDPEPARTFHKAHLGASERIVRVLQGAETAS